MVTYNKYIGIQMLTLKSVLMTAILAISLHADSSLSASSASTASQLLVIALILVLVGTPTYFIAKMKNLGNWGWHLVGALILFPFWWIVMLVFFKKKTICPNCHKRINADSNLCSYCGESIRKQ